MIPFGPWHPDKAGLNVPAVLGASGCLPSENGFRPLPSPQALTGELGYDFIADSSGNVLLTGTNAAIYSGTSSTSGQCLGAAVVFDDDGDVFTFAGDNTRLFLLDSFNEWLDVSRTSGGAYGASSGERWQFGFAGGLVVAVNIADNPQKYLLGTSTNFEALGGTPPKARYIATVRDFVVLGGLENDERTIHWSGLANAEHWTTGTQSSDTQTFQNGGPVRGIVGGEVGYVFQAEKIVRMNYAPGSEAIFTFDDLEGGRGLAAPYSLVRLGGFAYYLSSDGLYRLSLAGAAAEPIGVGKFSRWLKEDMKAGSEATVLGAVDPVGRFLLFAYNSADHAASDLNRVIIIDWAIGEATTVEMSVQAIAQILTQGINMDTMDGYGSLDELPFSLDSGIWRGGASLLGLFTTDTRMRALSGTPMEATITTGDGGRGQRTLIKGLRPHIDTTSITAAIAAREREGDAVTFAADEAMEDTGIIAAWASGFVARARLTVAEGASWSAITGASPVIGNAGNR